MHTAAWSCVSAHFMKASHGTVRFTNPIAAQPVRLQSHENDCIKMACNRTAQPVMEIGQPKSEPCSTPQRAHECIILLHPGHASE